VPIDEKVLDAIRERYDAGAELLSRLEAANEIIASDFRSERAAELDDVLQALVAIGLFEDSAMLTPEDETLLVEYDAELDEIIFEAQSVNDMASIELQIQHAQLLQHILGHEGIGILKLVWLRASPLNRKREVPPEVHDLYSVEYFNRVHFAAGIQAKKCQRIIEMGCANGEDFSGLTIKAGAVTAQHQSAQIATATYLDYEAKQRALEDLEKQIDASPGIVSQIWSVIGWDDPVDFLSDVVLTVATGGAGKAAKWAGKLYKVKRRISKAKKIAGRLQRLEDQLERIHKGYDKVFVAAGRIRKLKDWRRIPLALAKMLNRLEKHEAQLEHLQSIRNAFLLSFGRGAVSTIVANIINGDFKGVASDLTKEGAKQSIDHYLNAKPFFADIERIRRSAIFKSVLLAPNRTDAAEKVFWRYFSLLVTREFVARAMIAVARKRAISADMALDVFIESLGSALESIIADHPLIPGGTNKLVQPIVRTALSTARKVLVNFAKDLDNVLHGTDT